MAKKKRGGAAKRAGSRRKTARPRTARKRASGTRANKVDLKAIRRQLAASADRLERLSKTRDFNADAVQSRLQGMMAQLDDLCDKNNPDGCHPTMVFPPPPSA